MRLVFSLTLFLAVVSFSTAQIDSLSVYNESVQFQEELNSEYGNLEQSPLDSVDLEHFKELPFFKIDNHFVVEASFKKFKKKKSVKLQTSTSRIPTYKIFGKLVFELNGESFELTLYQSPKFKLTPGYEDYLFLPFTDLTNGDSSYGGGRYLDFRIPTTEKVLLNFNKAYNPYCAYSDKYSCPIPPKNNFLNIEIKAGVAFKGDEH